MEQSGAPMSLFTYLPGANFRNEEINKIASSITQLHTIFKELAVLVIDQGSILDRIDYNIEQVVHQSSEANKQLRKAGAMLCLPFKDGFWRLKRARRATGWPVNSFPRVDFEAMRCIYFLVIVNLASCYSFK